MSDLKPCPFCGDVPVGRTIAGVHPPRWKVECRNEDCDMLVRAVDNVFEEAVALWNRRAP